jgi:hypothetical protein
VKWWFGTAHHHLQHTSTTPFGELAQPIDSLPNVIDRTAFPHQSNPREVQRPTREILRHRADLSLKKVEKSRR